MISLTHFMMQLQANSAIVHCDTHSWYSPTFFCTLPFFLKSQFLRETATSEQAIDRLKNAKLLPKPNLNKLAAVPFLLW